MKKFTSVIILFIFLILMTSIVSATNYYVSNKGLDSNNGLSESTSIKTIKEVNTLNLKPGDSVLFKRGDRWNLLSDDTIYEKSGSSSGNITYGAYGTGAKPIFTRSINANKTTDWINLGNNLWQTTFTMDEDVGLIIFNNEKSWGIKVLSLLEVNSQGKFYYDPTTDKTTIYSASNPATYYTIIELSKKGNIFDVVDKSYILIRDLDLRYSAKGAIFITGSDHIYVYNISAKFIGGAIQEGSIRYGNGLEVSGDSSYIYVDKCYFYQIYDAGVSNQDQTVGYHNYIYFTNNIISNSRYCYEFINKDVSSTTNMIVFDHNTCYMSGNSFGAQYYGYHVRTGQQRGTIANLKITNNVFYNSKTNAILIDDVFNTGALTLNNNLYYEPSSSDTLIEWQSTMYTYADFPNYQNTINKDINSKTSDPQFTNPSSGDFKPKTGSPACTMSSTGSYVGAIPCGGTTPVTNTAPTQGTPTIRASDNPKNTTDAILYCYNTTTVDAQKDTVTYTYKWFKNNVVQSGLNGYSVAASYTSVGDVWKCEMRPYDGKIYGTAKNSTTITIRTAPVTSTASGLRGSWDLATNYIDTVIGNSALAYGNTIFVSDSIYGSVLKFDKSNSYLKIPYTDSSLRPQEGFTVDVKVKFNSVRQSYVVSDVESYLLQRLYIDATTSRFQAGVFSNNVWTPILNSVTNLQTGKWYRVTYTYDQSSGMFKLYLDKKLNTQKTWSGTVDASSSSQIFVGNREQMDRWLDGSIHDLKIYNRALSDTEVSTLV